MDSCDRKIISELRRDSRISLSDLADIIGVSRVTVRTRLERLKEQGIILGFTVVLKEDTHRSAVRGLTMLAIEGIGADRIKRQLGGLPAVQAIHATNGKWDLILEIGTETLEALDTVLATIRRIDGVMSSETNLLLATQMSTSRQS